jgi:SprT-like family
MPFVPEAAIPLEVAARINGYVDKYMDLLQIAGERPRIKISHDSTVNWLGRIEWRTERPHTSIIELQKRLLKNDRHLERTIAHEMVHHRDFLALPKDEIARIAAGTVPSVPSKHSASFLEGASRVNAIMGPGFVVEEEEPEDLPKYLLAAPRPGDLSTRLMLVLGLGGAAFLGIMLLKRRSLDRQRDPELGEARTGLMPARSARKNERGSYGR